VSSGIDEGEIVSARNKEDVLLEWAQVKNGEPQAELRAMIRAEVVSLKSLEREAVLRCFWQELEPHEIARRMKLSERAVRKLLEMGLRTLKRRLNEAGIGKDFVIA
jgi:DNA-directed RNA polymerase specialized sigma24 family protein